MPEKPAMARNTTPQGKDTRPARKKAYRPLQRRLRQALGYVDWRDAVAGALLGQAIQAMGGSDTLSYLHELLHLLFGGM